MKTCPNPNCKTTGIPDDAKFCPGCGEPLPILLSPWKSQIETLQEERADLREQRSQLLEFAVNRERLFSQLSKNDQYVQAMQASRNHIKQMHEDFDKRDKKANRAFAIGAIVGFVLGIVVFLILDIFATAEEDRWQLGTIIFGGGLFPLSCALAVGVFLHVIFVPRAIKNNSLTNQYVDDYISPFVESNFENYKAILGLPNVYLETEIMSPNSIEEAIDEKIEKIDGQINEINQKIQTMHAIS